jgi:hypothetical protein
MVEKKAKAAGHSKEKAEKTGHGGGENRTGRSWWWRKQNRQLIVEKKVKSGRSW